MSWILNTVFGQIVLLSMALVVTHLVVKRFLAVFIRRTVRSHHFGNKEAEKKREDTLINITGTVISVLLWVIWVIGLLAILHVNIAGLLTGAGVIGVVIGLGGQAIIKDSLAGMFILMENQYRVGDIVTLNGVSGVVERITLRITKLRDLDGNMHVVPNGSIGVATNLTFGWSNINMNIGVSYDSDLDKVKQVINDTGKSMSEEEEWSKSIVEPILFLRVENFEDSSVSVKALGRVAPGKQWEVAGEFRSRLKKAFDKNNIEIPFPQRVVHEAVKKQSSIK